MSSDPFALSRRPDLVVGDLRLWIVNRQFPENQDYWDGNWLDPPGTRDPTKPKQRAPQRQQKCQSVTTIATNRAFQSTGNDGNERSIHRSRGHEYAAPPAEGPLAGAGVGAAGVGAACTGAVGAAGCVSGCVWIGWRLWF